MGNWGYNPYKWSCGPPLTTGTGPTLYYIDKLGSKNSPFQAGNAKLDSIRNLLNVHSFNPRNDPVFWQKKVLGSFSRGFLFHAPKDHVTLQLEGWMNLHDADGVLGSSKWRQWLEGSASLGRMKNFGRLVCWLGFARPRLWKCCLLLPPPGESNLEFMIGWGPWHKNPYVYLKPSHGLYFWRLILQNKTNFPTKTRVIRVLGVYTIFLYLEPFDDPYFAWKVGCLLEGFWTSK